MLKLMLCFLLLAPLSAQTLKIDGGAAPMNNIFKKVKVAFEKASGMTLELKESGPEGSLASLNKGEVDAAAAGLTPGSWFELMTQKGFTGLDPKAFHSETIGFDKINVLMHADLVILSLDKPQLKALFTGATRNWKDLGGPDLPVVLVLGKGLSGTNKVFQEQMMDKVAYRADATWVETTPEIQAAIASTPGAVGIGPIATLQDIKLASPVTPEVGRPITLMTKGQPSPALQKLLAFIKGEGSALIAK